MTDPRVLVGATAGDDAAVVRLDDERALVSTVDFFTPIVDDPRDFGRIAAANAYSDVWAMGARPLFALSIVAFPRDELPLEVLREIVEGANEVAREAEAPIVGGHSIDDPVPKFGLAVTGMVDPAHMRTHAGGQPGDVLILTKPLGVGVIATAIKRGVASEETIAGVTAQMRTLNRAAAEVLAPRCTALTDVTGYGLLGHLRNLCKSSGLGAEVDASAVPVRDEARHLAAAGVVPGGSRANLAHLRQWARFDPGVDEVTQLLLADAQTNGGLLAAVPPARVEEALRGLEERGQRGWIVGALREGDPAIHVR